MNNYDTFVTVVELKSFSAAAKKLHRSPSAISKQMNLLEQKVEVQLLNRTTRSLSLTEAGKLYYDRCKDISQRMKDAESEIKDVSAKPSGVINITLPDILSDSKVYDVICDFVKAYPDIKVRIKISADIINLTEENIDFAFRTGPPVDSSMIGIELFRIQPLICAAPDIIQQYGMPKKVEDLVNMPYVFESHIDLNQKAREQLPDFKFDHDEHHQVNNHTALYQMAIRGLGAAVLFRHTVRKDLEKGTLVDLTEQHKLNPLPVYLMYQGLSYIPQKIRYFIDYCKEHLRE